MYILTCGDPYVDFVRTKMYVQPMKQARIELRCTDDEKKGWSEAAAIAKVDISYWIREIL